VNVLVYFLAAIACYGIAYRLYGRYIARSLGESPGRPTPAVAQEDGKDFVPTRPSILFAHHYSTIAGAGPIVGPTLGILYGIGPAWLWIVLGAIFIGGVHDFVALFASVREKGASMAEVARKALGPTGFLLFIAFTIILIILVTSAFLSLTAVSLTSMRPLAELGLTEHQTLIRTTEVDGQTLGIVGGIASTSVIFITLMAPLIGLLVIRRNVRTSITYLIATVVGFVSVYIGFQMPLALPPLWWMVIISIYTLFACQAPVWLILQPRDFVNVQLLYAGMLALMAGVIVGGVNGLSIAYPSLSVAVGTEKMGPIWPFLFITIACGAISGFHALVAGGTSSKQLAKEPQARAIGYGGMLLEGTLAILVLIAIGSSITYSEYLEIAWPTGIAGNPILAFATAMGHLLHSGFGLSIALGTVMGILIVEGFLITTLDSAVRLNRYLFEELWRSLTPNPPAVMKKFWFNSGLSVVLMFVLAQSQGWKYIWPVFGATNQLLAALTLIAATVWLHRAGRRSWYTLAPAILMMATTIAALSYQLVTHYWPQKNVMLAIMSILLLALAIGVLFISLRQLFNPAAKASPFSA
jgi:carbon starvation protein